MNQQELKSSGLLSGYRAQQIHQKLNTEDSRFLLSSNEMTFSDFQGSNEANMNAHKCANNRLHNVPVTQQRIL